jgi:hypothetical protein
MGERVELSLRRRKGASEWGSGKREGARIGRIGVRGGGGGGVARGAGGGGRPPARARGSVWESGGPGEREPQAPSPPCLLPPSLPPNNRSFPPLPPFISPKHSTCFFVE